MTKPKKSWRREEDERNYQYRYTHVYPHGELNCGYCGERAQCLDHVPPISQAYRFEYTGADGEFVLIPACSECNSALGDAVINDFTARRRFLYDRYTSKYRTLLSAPEWDEDELEEMGRNMRTKIERDQKRMQIVKRRLKILRSTVDM